MRTSLEGLIVRPYGDEDLDEVLALMRKSLQGGPMGERTRRFFHWKHFENPFGPSVALVAEIDGRIVGLRTFMRWPFWARGQSVQAVRAVDTATHPDYRRRGIFRTLTLEALEMIRRDTQLVFNTPNSRSLPGYLKMGWQEVGPIRIAIRITRPWRFVRGLPGVKRGGSARGGGISTCPFPPVEELLRERGLPALLDRVGAGARLTTARDVAYLRWRYADASGLDYRAITQWAGDDLIGVAIGRPRERGPLEEFTLTDLIVRDGDHATARRLLRDVTKAGTDHVAAHLATGTAGRRMGPLLGYVPVPTRVMTLVARPLQRLEPDPIELSSWQLSLGDLELF